MYKIVNLYGSSFSKQCFYHAAKWVKVANCVHNNARKVRGSFLFFTVVNTGLQMHLGTPYVKCFMWRLKKQLTSKRKL